MAEYDSNDVVEKGAADELAQEETSPTLTQLEESESEPEPEPGIEFNINLEEIKIPEQKAHVKLNHRLCANGWLAEYLEYTKNQSSPEAFHLWTGISILAGALRRNVWIDREGYFNLYPNLYTMLIAPQGKCHKSTAAKIGVRMLKAMQDIPLMLEKVTPEGLIGYLSGDVLDPDQDMNSSMRGARRTVRKVLEDGKNIQVHEDACVYIFASELATLIGSASYTDTLIENLVNMYDCPDEGQYTTKSSGKKHIPNVCTNMLGCSTPIWLAKGLKEEGVSGGFAGRIIFVYKDSGGKKLSLLKKKKATMDDTKIKLVHDLMKIKELAGQFTITDDGVEFYDQWLQSYDPDMTGRLGAYFERKPDHILKLSMVLSVNESDDLIISVRHLQAAIALLEEQERHMGKAFTFVGATNEARVSQLILDMINAYPAKFVSYKRLLGNCRHLIKNKREFEDIMDLLVVSGHVKMFAREGMRYFTVDENLINYLKEVESLAEADAKKEVMAAHEQRLEIDRQARTQQHQQQASSIEEVVNTVMDIPEKKETVQ